jgi:hypothetical protein
MKSFRKKTTKQNLYKEYVKILNGVLQLSYREAEVFAVLLRLNEEWAEVVANTHNILSTDIRKKLMNDTRITKTNLVKYINSLKDKNIIIPNEYGGWYINETFVPYFTGGINETVFILDAE